MEAGGFDLFRWDYSGDSVIPGTGYLFYRAQPPTPMAMSL